MSLFSKIGSIVKSIPKVVSSVVSVGKDILGGLTGTSGIPSVTGAGGAISGLPQARTMPQAMPGVLPQLQQSFGTQVGQFARQALTGAVGGGFRKTKFGKLTGNPIPVGYVEKMSQSGVIYLSKATRRRGISSRDLRSFRRVHRLIASVQRKTFGKKGR